MSEALKILKGMSDRDVISWTALISGCLENGLCQDALTCMKLMEKESILPNAFTLVSLLKACSLTQDLDIGHKLYMQIMKEGLYTDFVICNSVVSMYAKCGSLTEACDVFYKFARQDIISWTSLISGYTDHGFYNEALNCFQSMEAAGVSPNTVSYNCSLKACAFTGNLKMGLKLHHDIVKEEFEKHSIVGNTLIHMYARCGFYQEAIAVFDDLPQHDVITWTTLIAELAEDGHGELALKKFDQMQARFFSPNSHTYVCVLKACACIGSIEKGRMLHIEITKRGLERNSYIIKALISMYAQCGKPICLG
ncbi:hypothetical protein KP509_31G060600 [Ceratopteris richardii]|nr:hypothetical protein KP509_31G060600 [Ceratopteris richardii]